MKSLGKIVGGLLLSVIILVECIGCSHSFVYNAEYQKKADREIIEQPIVFHIFPKSFRYGIYDVQNFFSDSDEE